MANRDDDVFLSVSITAECNTLRSPQEGPERLRLYPVKTETVPAKCNLPDNYTGIWVNTANFDAEVTINSTHMVERWKPDTGRVKQEIYICQERRGSRFVMARMGINGWYAFFDFFFLNTIQKFLLTVKKIMFVLTLCPDITTLLDIEKVKQ